MILHLSTPAVDMSKCSTQKIIATAAFEMQCDKNWFVGHTVTKATHDWIHPEPSTTPQGQNIEIELRVLQYGRSLRCWPHTAVGHVDSPDTQKNNELLVALVSVYGLIWCSASSVATYENGTAKTAFNALQPRPSNAEGYCWHSFDTINRIV